MKVSMKNAPLVPITDLLECIIDNRGKSCPTSKSGFPLIATNCIKHSSIYPTFENIRYVSEEIRNTWFRAELKPNDILFVNKGTPGRVCLVPNPITFCAAQDMIGLRADSSKIYYKYLFAVLRSNFIQEKIANFHVGIAIPHFKKSDLNNLLIPVPNMDVQYKIGDLFFDLSEKIELNRKINDNLEAQAKCIFGQWFLQYDFPNEKGEPYKSSGGIMSWNDTLNRNVPAGWEIRRIKDYITSSRGISYSSNTILSGQGNPMINLANFAPGGGSYKESGLKYYDGKFSNDKILKPYDLVMCNTQQTAIKFDTDIIGRTFLIPDIFEKQILSSHHVNVINVKHEYLKTYFLYLFNSDFFHKYIAGYTNGTNILGLNFEGVENYITEIPPLHLLKEFYDLIINIEKMKSTVLKENKLLQDLRDWLLPLLINTQITIK